MGYPSISAYILRGTGSDMDETIIDGVYIRNLFAKNLKRFREILKISQLDLADASGLAHNFINDIENEKKFVSDETIAKLSKALKVEPYKFFLPVAKVNTQGEDIFAEDFSESISTMIKEYCSSYFRDNKKENLKENPEDAAEIDKPTEA
jgi:transcriptional regulator with XRE-family HTH domain